MDKGNDNEIFRIENEWNIQKIEGPMDEQVFSHVGSQSMRISTNLWWENIIRQLYQTSPNKSMVTRVDNLEICWNTSTMQLTLIQVENKS